MVFLWFQREWKLWYVSLHVSWQSGCHWKQNLEVIPYQLQSKYKANIVQISLKMFFAASMA